MLEQKTITCQNDATMTIQRKTDLFKSTDTLDIRDLG